ncbi:MAG: GHKL domain-containing protein [Clostridium sp.]|nr:GHKL domain-containing protein [Clostridium sp.]
MPKTSKDDKNYHGYGTKSIVYVIKKLHGKVSFTADESTFTVKAVIPIKE